MVYFGKSNCKNNYENYIEIIKYVFSSYKRESPLIINTMGWVTGKAPEAVGQERTRGTCGWGTVSERHGVVLGPDAHVLSSP